ncbi:hypothetical protein I79_006072 [Cricetulus griseus]|uniref:Uncharacterized protein n=1 Tax=Cricetulus griseus TaxID=10029 RepID=G3H6V2_CRIGR|nr:hypothetical protein I79_006072 [Cricetulus griseus]
MSIWVTVDNEDAGDKGRHVCWVRPFGGLEKHVLWHSELELSPIISDGNYLSLEVS